MSSASSFSVRVMAGTCHRQKLFANFFSTPDFGGCKPSTMFEIILFKGEACAGAANTFDYPANEKHGFLLFFRQPKNLPPNFDGAQRALEKLAWQEVKLSQASPIAMEESTLSSAHPEAPVAYQKALISGFSTLVSPKPILENTFLPHSSRHRTDDALVNMEGISSQKESAFSDAATAVAVFAQFHELYLAMARAAGAVKKVQKSVKNDKVMLRSDALELRDTIADLQKRHDLFFGELKRSGVVEDEAK